MAAIDQRRLGLNMSTSDQDIDWALSAQTDYARFAAYVSHLQDPRYFMSWGDTTPVAEGTPGARTMREWFYYEMDRFRQRGILVALVPIVCRATAAGISSIRTEIRFHR